MPALARAFAAPRILGSLALTSKDFYKFPGRSFSQFRPAVCVSAAARGGRRTRPIQIGILDRAVLRLPNFGRATLKLKAFAVEGIGGVRRKTLSSQSVVFDTLLLRRLENRYIRPLEKRS
jgi:hypothetical protein